MRAAVFLLAACVFCAALILDTSALLRLPFLCATGSCGQTAKWVVWTLGGLLGVVVLVALVRRRLRARQPAPRMEGRRPGPSRKPRRQQAARSAGPSQRRRLKG
ncbi:conserved protein of unknown function [Rhodovastum atsumiense]|uniref:Uncharacterized protein n=1 Tax=Rhodovastum atsumiense TaxID=504468 RepID=A0A5M6ILJ1_9PROT|nr:hypothetical protein [Rhodovastum atsumiense]KAA5609141.1 hypothetical protein F1189_25550 [Rhodovastum atsumiense]CAH2601251.1 conserved protein of unknown function [Rhodovastum atsumiense]